MQRCVRLQLISISRVPQGKFSDWQGSASSAWTLVGVFGRLSAHMMCAFEHQHLSTPPQVRSALCLHALHVCWNAAANKQWQLWREQMRSLACWSEPMHC